MAESAGHTDEDRSEAGELAETEAQEASPPKRFPFWLLLIPAILLPASAGGYVAYDKYDEIVTRISRTGVAGGAEAPRKYGQFAEIENVIINPAGSGGQRYLMVTIGLEASSASTLDEVKRREVVVRDTMLKILGNMTVDELADIGRRDDLKESLRAAVNRILSDGKIDYLYFTRFVLQ